MQLSPGERSILAYFPSSEAAQRAAKALSDAGFSQAGVDRVSRYGVSTDPQMNNPVNNAVTQTGPTLYSDSTAEELTDSGRILLTADPSVSGYGNTDYGVAGGKAFLLTLVTTEKRIEEAEKIVSRLGGSI
ncbi:MAG: hypothetical protein JL50_17255 [Peptococcaceae bacterium BICA1-7]|nr:MAG: hypothetical protein JL50_17255 [Peptococcaceae bacterium BICA1-7]HBV98703.1 hypothetical protein [Desulfotomaculum sp.]